jgi:NAD(P)-dependent dehydrogenase (short-subunit alcohol dehydrogenase family)
MSSSVIITGCLGGIGSKLVEAFHQEGWNVIGIDREGERAEDDQIGHVIEADIADLSAHSAALTTLGAEVRARADGAPLCALINNAAIQNLGPLAKLTTPQIVESMHVNLIAPMLLAKEFLPELNENEGSIVNIGSVHAQATKPGFAAYATSKAALHGMTRALAVDLGPHINVNTLAPAATSTAMLLAGFEGQEEALAELEDVHPLKRIASPEEIAQLALFLTSEKARFVTGATFFADGGILSRLHDPV